MGTQDGMRPLPGSGAGCSSPSTESREWRRGLSISQTPKAGSAGQRPGEEGTMKARGGWRGHGGDRAETVGMWTLHTAQDASVQALELLPRRRVQSSHEDRPPPAPSARSPAVSERGRPASLGPGVRSTEVKPALPAVHREHKQTSEEPWGPGHRSHTAEQTDAGRCGVSPD